MKHKHAELIIAWANGKEIEYLDERTNTWAPATTPKWDKGTQYRLAPKKIYYKANGLGYLRVTDEVTDNFVTQDSIDLWVKGNEPFEFCFVNLDPERENGWCDGSDYVEIGFRCKFRPKLVKGIVHSTHTEGRDTYVTYKFNHLIDFTVGEQVKYMEGIKF